MKVTIVIPCNENQFLAWVNSIFEGSAWRVEVNSLTYELQKPFRPKYYSNRYVISFRLLFSDGRINSRDSIQPKIMPDSLGAFYFDCSILSEKVLKITADLHRPQFEIPFQEFLNALSENYPEAVFEYDGHSEPFYETKTVNPEPEPVSELRHQAKRGVTKKLEKLAFDWVKRDYLSGNMEEFLRDNDNPYSKTRLEEALRILFRNGKLIKVRRRFRLPDNPE